MFEVLLSLCLAADPSACRVERHPGGASYAACRDEADHLRRAAADIPQEWPCVAAGTAPAFRVTEIAAGVFVHKGRHEEAGPENRGDIANLGFIVGETAVAVIDAGGTAELARDLLAAIRAHTDLPVKWLILTHMHPDHSLGAGVFAEAGAAVVGHRRLASALAARFTHYLDANRRLIGAALAGTEHPGPIAEAPGRIDLGGRELTLEAHPTTHTDNDLTVFDEQTGTWFLGDLLFVDHLPALDGSLLGWIERLSVLAARPAARAVPGHGPVAVAWPDSAQPMRAYLEALAAGTRSAIAAGLPMLEAMNTVGADSAAGWRLHALFHQRNVSAAYKELEWE